MIWDGIKKSRAGRHSKAVGVGNHGFRNIEGVGGGRGRTTGPADRNDHRTGENMGNQKNARGPEDQETRATPGLSHIETLQML